MFTLAGEQRDVFWRRKEQLKVSRPRSFNASADRALSKQLYRFPE
jgi:hypothetical protein